MSNNVKVLVENQLAHILLNRPDKLNALSSDLIKELTENLTALEKDPEVKIILLSGEGKSFCTGGDLDQMSNDGGIMDTFKIMEQAIPLTNALINLEKIVVSAVHGYAAGAGFSIALACDFVIADRSAKFASSFTNVGLIPDLGLIKLLSQRLPLPIAKEWIITGKAITSEEALAKGMVNKISENNLIEEAKDFCRTVSKGSPMSNKYAKYLLNHASHMDWETALMHEKMIQTILLSTMDHKEGIQAFLEKRVPNFQGK
ncbi:enoyl-CoA hydratase/isomerase family protein [Peribacillus frigoritolerans]|uniref:enoyl-CoA hydratase/isomerase family protein n=1 Tax=Peribacillus frigoritolerans TaxID=450367 RepID=UPI003807538B